MITIEDVKQFLTIAIDNYRRWESDAELKADKYYYMGMKNSARDVLRYIEIKEGTIE